jgi:uncharacterized protein YndB with AHSA1/START domain
MDIKHNFRIEASPKKVYEAITTQQGIHGWWANDADVMQNVGQVSKMRFAKEAGPVEMQFRIDSLQPPNKVQWTCVSCPNPAWTGTKISFDITETANGCDFTFIHGGWDPKWRDQLPYQQTKEGWQHFMQSIKAYCETGNGQPW